MPTRPHRPRDRRRWFRAAATGAAVVGGGLVYAFAIEPRRLQMARIRLGIEGLPTALEGVRVAHLTDFHVGTAGTRRSTLRHAVRAALDERPDVVALTGDFVDDGVWRPGATLFADLAAAAPTFAVLGNHDRDAGPGETARVVAGLRAQGVRVLRNEHVVVPVRGRTGELVVVAVDDPSTDRDDLAATMRGLPATAEPERPALLLGHAPDIVERAPPRRFALTLAGHTHGGQLRFSPFKRFTPLELPMIAADLDSRYPRGIHVVHGNPLFVNNGLGVSGVPFRFLAPPQVAIFALTGDVDRTKTADDPDRYLMPPTPDRPGDR